MENSINHLPGVKKNELERIVSVIKDTLKNPPTLQEINKSSSKQSSKRLNPDPSLEIKKTLPSQETCR